MDKAVFVTYGCQFVQLIGLPDKAVTTVPFIEQIPKPYQDMFIEGYDQARIASLPVILEGSFDMESDFDLFRAVFMPIMLQPHWSKQLILGSFDFPAAGAASAPQRRAAAL